MKKLSLIIVLALSISQAFAQCTPNSSYANSPYGLYPDPNTFVTNSSASAGNAYAGVLDLKTLSDTLINASGFSITVFFDRTRIASVTGLPSGFSYTEGGPSFNSNTNAWFNSGSGISVQPVQGCISITASEPSVTNAAPASGYTDYPLVITVDLRVAATNPDVNGLVLDNGTWFSETTLADPLPITGYVLRVHANNNPCAGFALDYDVTSTPTSCPGTSTGVLEVAVNSGGQSPYSYAWSTGNTGTSAGNFSISNVESGSYNLTITDDSGCEAEILNLIVDEGGPTVTFDEISDVCTATQAFDLTGGSPAGGFYTINGNPSTEFDPSVLGEGTYSVDYAFTDGNNCTVSSSQQVFVETAPQVSILGAVEVDPNTSNEYAMTIPSGYTVNWSAVNGAILSGQGTNLVTIFWDQNASGQVTAELTNGSCTFQVSVNIGDFIGISESYKEYFSISPNPSNGVFQITVKDHTENVAAFVFDATGREVLNKTIPATGGVIDLSTQPDGIYVVKFSTQKGQMTQRLVKY